MIHRRRALLLVGSLAACHADHSGPTPGPGMCTTVQAPQSASLPAIHGTGAIAQGLAQALAGALAAQSPAPAPATQRYGIVDLGCSNLFDVPGATPGYGCTFSVSIDGRSAVDVALARPSTPAMALYDAMAAAGMPCEDEAHGEFFHWLNVTLDVGADTLDAEDNSSYVLPEPANVHATGKAARDVLDALHGGGVSDCDPMRSTFVLCNAFNGAPTCSTTTTALSKVGSSELLYSCLPDDIEIGVQLDAAGSSALFAALVAAAGQASFQPDDGTLAAQTVLNVSSLSWDGTTLAFHLVTGDVSPPPAPQAP